jgi:hypothetical protein
MVQRIPDVPKEETDAKITDSAYQKAAPRIN